MDGDVLDHGRTAMANGKPDAGRLDLRASGMSCASCLRRVERAAAAVPGVKAVAVNLVTERATVTAAPTLRLPDLASVLAKSGYPVAEDRVDLPITGMSCASCVGRVERALLRVRGVLAAEVNLGTERARVRVAAGTAGPGELVAAVQAAGYDATLPGAVASTGHGHEHDMPLGVAPGCRNRDGLMAAAACVLAAPLVLPMLLMPFGMGLALPAPAQLVLAGIVQLVFGARF